MDVRPVYWVLCGAGATLLTSAWGSKQAVLPPLNQNANAATALVQANLDLPQSVANTSLLMRRQPWAEPKSDPFSKAAPVEQNVIAPTADKVAMPQPPSFTYVFIGRLLAEEKNTVFLSRNNQIYSVAAGDTLEGVYRIERVGSDTLEITYLPDRKKITLPFDSLAASPAPQAAAVLSQADVPSIPPVQAQALPEGMAGEVPSESNGQMTEDLKQMLAPPPPPQGDVLKMMGATPPPQGDAMQMMAAPAAQGGQGMPGVSAELPVPVTPQQAGQ